MKTEINESLLAEVVGFYGGGVQKRIDENRELYELLKNAAPDFLEKHDWVAGWLESEDHFLVGISNAVKVKQQLFGPRQNFPRPRPLKFQA